VTIAVGDTLWAWVPFAVLGTILPGIPFDVLHNYDLRHSINQYSGTPVLPRYGVRRRLACGPGDRQRFGPRQKAKTR